MKKLIIKMCVFMILITLFTGCHPQNKLYSFETKKIDDQVILILKNTSKKPIENIGIGLTVIGENPILFYR